MLNKKFVVTTLVVASMSFFQTTAAIAQEEAPMVNTLQLPYGQNVSSSCSKLVAETAISYAAENSWNVSVAVSDTAGLLVAFHRMDNAHRASIDFAFEKAASAALTKRSTKFFADALGSGRNAILGFVDLHVHVAEGGEVLILDDHIVGAIGVAGVTQKQDREIAVVAMEALTNC